MSRPKNAILSVCFVAALGLVGCGGHSAGGGDAGDDVDAGTDAGSPAVTLVTLTILPANPDLVAGTTRQFAASGSYSDSTSQDLTQAVTWTSSNTNFASIDSSGLATAHSQGVTTITATSGTVSATTQVTVSPAPLVSIDVTPANPTLTLPGQVQMTATGHYADNHTQDLSNNATWLSSAPGTASVSSAGMVSAVVAGRATISASLAGVSGNTAATVKGAVSLPKTGQTVSYSAGDDGDLQVGLAWPTPRFTTNDCGTPADITDDVITDLLTGLMWLRKPGTTTLSWQQSLDLANNLVQCGYSDWRLANVFELESLVSLSSYNWLGTQGFSVWGTSYWVSTSQELFPNRAWGPDFFGNTQEYPKTSATYAWPVRDGGQPSSTRLPKTGQTKCYDSAGTLLASCAGTGQDGELQAGMAWPSTRFIVNDCGTPADPTDDVVTDALTGLMWSRQGNLFAQRTWAQALTDARGISLCGFADWRLPNSKELRSLVHHGQAIPGTWLESQGFQNIQSPNTLPCYWSSTSPSVSPQQAMCLYLYQGSISSDSKTNSANRYVLPVRGSPVL